MTLVESIAPRHPLGVVLTCEHASNRLWDLGTTPPTPREWPAADAHVAEDHWAWDPGAARLTRAVAARIGAGAVLAGFSRLQCDPNRDLDEPTLMRAECDGHVLALNAGLDAAERARRIDALWRPYHAATRALALAVRPRLVLSFHSFTPCYEGSVRDVQLGVLHHSPESPWPRAFHDAFRARSDSPVGPLDVRFNEPWPGTIMFGPDRCAAAVGAVPLELEVRNDLLQRDDMVAFCADVVAGVLAAQGLLG